MRNNKKKRAAGVEVDAADEPQDEAPRKPRKRVNVELDAILAESLDAVLERLKIAGDADYVIFSDGSGADFSMGCGYASVVVDREAKSRTLLFGALNRGTVNIAEMLAVLQGLDYLVNLEATRRANKPGRRLLRTVHIITDSQYCQTTGESGRGRTAKRNVGIWSMFESYARQGLVLHWHHINRATCGLNVLCDAASKLARIRLRDYNIDRDLSAGDSSMTLDQVNPGD